MPHATVRLDNHVIELSPRLESMIRVEGGRVCNPGSTYVSRICHRKHGVAETMNRIAGKKLEA